MDLLFALKDKKFVSIDEVERGLGCNCVCINCGDRLVAKKGNKRKHHFSHVTKTKQEIKHCSESSLHLMAKYIIMNAATFMLPKEDVVFNGKKQIIAEKKLIKVDKVEVEKNIIDKIRTDLLITSNNKQYSIEIFVSHKCSDKKNKVLIDNKIETIEINLSSFVKDIRDYDKKLKRILLEEDALKSWIYNQDIENFITEKERKIKQEQVLFIRPEINELNKTNYKKYFNYVKTIPIVNIKGIDGPKFCPERPKKYIEKMDPLDIEIDCGHCIYYKGIDNNCVLCAKLM